MASTKPYELIRSASAFFADPASYDAAVSKSPGVLDFCSSSYWTQAAHAALHRDEREEGSFIAAHDSDQEHWIAFAKGASWFWEPLENAWPFACPLLGPDPGVSLDLLEAVAAYEFEGAAAFLIGALPAGGDLLAELRSREYQYRRVLDFDGMVCMTIDLSDGVDPWLARRTSRFRKNLRACRRRVSAAGVEIEEAQGDWESMLDRLLRVQVRTEKWLRGDDIFHHVGYLQFYSKLAEAALRDGMLRLLFARRGGDDIAFILGVDFQGTYRGLQMSFVAEEASLGVGNVLQFENIVRSAEAGTAGYDLGMFSEYKVKWTDRQVPLRNVLLII